MDNMTQIIQTRFLEDTEKQLSIKLQWLETNVSTHPKYIEELKNTGAQLLKLEAELRQLFSTDTIGTSS